MGNDESDMVRRFSSEIRELGQEACGYLQAALAELRRAMSNGDIALTSKRLDAFLLILDTFTLPMTPGTTT